MSVKIDWNNKIFRSEYTQQAFDETVEELEQAMREAIQADIWPWMDGGTRDIVDTGELLNSQSMTRNSATSWALEWDVPYALYVHEGYKMRNGTRVKARPWTELVLNEFNFDKVFERNYRRILRSR